MCEMQHLEEAQGLPDAPLDQQVALYASRSTIDGAVFLNNGFCFRGIAKFHGVKITRTFMFEPMQSPHWRAIYDDKDALKHVAAWRLDLEDAEIGSNLSLNLMPAGFSSAQVGVLFELAKEAANNSDVSQKGLAQSSDLVSESISERLGRIYSWLETTAPQAQYEFLRLLDERVNRREQAKDAKMPCRGRVDLTNARCESYADDFHFLRGNWMPRKEWPSFTTQYSYGWGEFFSSWPKEMALDLEGFVYKRFSGRGLDTRLSGVTRIKWLQHQYNTEEPEGPYGWIVPIAWWALLVIIAFNTSIGAPPDAGGSAADRDVNAATTAFRWVAIAVFPIFCALIKAVSFANAKKPLLIPKRTVSGQAGNSAPKFLGTRAAIVLIFVVVFLILLLARALVVESSGGWVWIGGGLLTVGSLAFARERRIERELRGRKVRQGIDWDRFKSQPWLHCANALRASGREEEARRVRLSRERLILHSKKIYFLERVFRGVLLTLFFCGLVRSYPVMWFAVIYLFAWQSYHIAFNSNLMRPTEALVLKTMEDRGSPLPPFGYATPRAQIFALEKMTPGMPFLQENRWAACAPQYIKAARALKTSNPRFADVELCVPRCVDFDALAKQAAMSAAHRYEFLSDQIAGGPSQSDVGGRCAKDGPDPSTPDSANATTAPFRPTDMSWTTRWLQQMNDGWAKSVDEFFNNGGARAAGWLFIAYGWLLIAGFAISISRLLLNED